MQANKQSSTVPRLEVWLEQGESVVTPPAELVWMTTSMRMSQIMSGGQGGGGFMVRKLEVEGTAWIGLSGERTTDH